MSEAPERIWVEFGGNPSDEIGAYWSSVVYAHRPNIPPEHQPDEGVVYIRADLVPGWQPIETAPKDGEPLMLGRHDEVETERWVSEGTWVAHHDPDGGWWAMLHPFISTQPTHWQPLPEPPEKRDA